MADAAFVLTLRNGRILAVSRGWPAVDYALPGGYLDPGEDAAVAAIRELYEETGLRAGRFIELRTTPGRDGCRTTFYAPRVRGQLRSSPEGRAVWADPEVLLAGPFGAEVSAALRALDAYLARCGPLPA